MMEISSQHPFSMECNFGSWAALAIAFENQSAVFKQYDSRQDYTAGGVVNNSQQYRRRMTLSSEQKWRAAGAVLIQRLLFKAIEC